MALTVDEYVKAAVLPQHQDIVKAIRDLTRECAPHAKEHVAHGVLAWKVKKVFATLTPNKKAITLSFAHGAEFEDKYGLLAGVAKMTRHIKFKDIQTLIANDDALRHYIRQALEFDRLVTPLPTNPKVLSFEIALRIDTGNMIYGEFSDPEDAKAFIRSFAQHPEKILERITPKVD